MARSMIGHPSDRRLRRWLDARGPVDDAVSDHVGRCERCADRLEQIVELDAAGGAPAAGDLSQAIRDFYTPPNDLAARIKNGISDQERAARDASLLLGLFAIAGDVAELLLPVRSSRPAERRGERRTPQEPNEPYDDEESAS